MEKDDVTKAWEKCIKYETGGVFKILSNINYMEDGTRNIIRLS